MTASEQPERIASMADMAETGVDGRAGMILGYRGGKMAMHHGGRPKFVAGRCTACGRCAEGSRARSA